LRCNLGQFDFDRASDVTFAIRRIEAAAPASGMMAAIRLSVPVDDARDTVVTLLFSKRTELDYSVAPQTVRLSGEQGPSEEIPTNEDVLARAASPCQVETQFRQQITLGDGRHAIVQLDTAVTSEFTIPTSQKTLME
jgi:hypothetical protein